jgi:hypothetical protein
MPDLVPSSRVAPESLPGKRGLLDRIGWRTDHLVQEILLGVLGFLTIAITLAAILTVTGADLRETMDRIIHYTSVERARFFGIGIAAALVEETLFRGLCQRWHVPIIAKHIASQGAEPRTTTISRSADERASIAARPLDDFSRA